MKITMRKDRDTLRPMYRQDIEEFEKLSTDTYMVKISRPRNLQHHNKFWAICRLLAEQVSDEKKQWSKDEISDWLKLKAGYVDYISKFDGNIYLKPRSISFESMDQPKFEEFWEKILPFVLERLGCTREEIDENLINYM